MLAPVAVVPAGLQQLVAAFARWCPLVVFGCQFQINNHSNTRRCHAVVGPRPAPSRSRAIVLSPLSTDRRVTRRVTVVLPQNIPTFSPRANKQKPQTASLRSRPTPYPAPILPSRCKHTTAAISLPRNPLVTLYLIHYDHHHSTRHPWAQRMQLSLSRRRPRIIAHPNPVHCRPGCPQPPPSRNHHCL